MSKRIFIIGGGRFGGHLATRLSEYGCEVIIADRSPRRVKELADDGFNTVELDAENEDALLGSGALEADAVIIAIGENLEGCILATLLLKQLKARHVIARALDVRHAQVLERVGADEVVLPSRDMAYRLAERLRDGTRGERFPLAGEHQIAEIVVASSWHGRTLAELDLPGRLHVQPILVKQADGDSVIVRPPALATRLATGDVLWLVGKREALNRAEHAMQRER